jgi:double-strand break repair protein MRE11
VDNMSAVDILASANLVNYFGKTTISGSGSGGVKISPILIRKGNTKLALYGLGNIRDERMCRLFNTPNGVEWARPLSNPIADVEDWVNVFVLHQNRVPHAQGAKNIVRESHLPKFLDVVIWGHEHECIAEVQVRRGLMLFCFSLCREQNIVDECYLIIMCRVLRRQVVPSRCCSQARL